MLKLEVNEIRNIKPSPGGNLTIECSMSHSINIDYGFLADIYDTLGQEEFLGIIMRIIGIENLMENICEYFGEEKFIEMAIKMVKSNITIKIKETQNENRR